MDDYFDLNDYLFLSNDAASQQPAPALALSESQAPAAGSPLDDYLLFNSTTTTGSSTFTTTTGSSSSPTMTMPMTMPQGHDSLLAAADPYAGLYAAMPALLSAELPTTQHTQQTQPAASTRLVVRATQAQAQAQAQTALKQQQQQQQALLSHLGLSVQQPAHQPVSAATSSASPTSAHAPASASTATRAAAAAPPSVTFWDVLPPLWPPATAAAAPTHTPTETHTPTDAPARTRPMLPSTLLVPPPSSDTSAAARDAPPATLAELVLLQQQQTQLGHAPPPPRGLVAQRQQHNHNQQQHNHGRTAPIPRILLSSMAAPSAPLSAAAAAFATAQVQAQAQAVQAVQAAHAMNAQIAAQIASSPLMAIKSPIPSISVSVSPRFIEPEPAALHRMLHADTALAVHHHHQLNQQQQQQQQSQALSHFQQHQLPLTPAPLLDAESDMSSSDTDGADSSDACGSTRRYRSSDRSYHRRREGEDSEDEDEYMQDVVDTSGDAKLDADDDDDEDASDDASDDDDDDDDDADMSSRGVSRQTSAAASPMSAKPRSLKGSHTPSPARAIASAAATATAAQQPARLHPDWDRLSLEDSLLLADTSLTAKERRLIRRSITIRNRRLRSGLGLGLSLGSGAASVAAPMPPAPSAGVPAGSAAVAVPRVPPIVIAAPPSAPVAPSNSRSLAASRRRSSAATTKALAAAAAASAAFAAANAAPPTDEIKTESETAPAQPTPRHMVIPIPPHTAHRRPTNFRAAIEQRRNNLQAFLRRISTPIAPGDTAMLTVSQQQQQQQQQDEQIRTDPLVANTLSAAAVMVPDLSTMWSAHCASMTPTVKVHTVWTPPTLLPLSKLSLSHSLERFGSSGNVSMERVSSTATDSGLPHPLLSKDMMDDSGGRGDENGFATPTDAWMASRRLLEDATGAASSGDAAVPVETTTEERELAHQLLVYYMLMNTAAAAVADAAADAAAVAHTSTPPPPSCL